MAHVLQCALHFDECRSSQREETYATTCLPKATLVLGFLITNVHRRPYHCRSVASVCTHVCLLLGLESEYSRVAVLRRTTGLKDFDQRYCLGSECLPTL